MITSNEISVINHWTTHHFFCTQWKPLSEEVHSTRNKTDWFFLAGSLMWRYAGARRHLKREFKQNWIARLAIGQSGWLIEVNNLANKISLPQDQSYTERAVALRKDIVLLAKLGLKWTSPSSSCQPSTQFCIIFLLVCSLSTRIFLPALS